MDDIASSAGSDPRELCLAGVQPQTPRLCRWAAHSTCDGNLGVSDGVRSDNPGMVTGCPRMLHKWRPDRVLRRNHLTHRSSLETSDVKSETVKHG